MTAMIHIGYEVGSGRAVEIPVRHTAVTGQTQESGKSTTLEALITRSGLRAVAYVTKRGESSFHVAHPIPPYFQERADWKFVQSLLEAATETKLKFEQSWIMRASEGARTLQDVRNNIRKFLNGVPDLTPRKAKKKMRGEEDDEPKKRWISKPARGLSADVYYVLDKYLDDIMPQIQELPYTTELTLAPGVNVMDLRDYEFPLQALVVRSVIDRVRLHEVDTINVIPEAWKFAPKQKGSPVRLAAEELIREGGALKNFLWIDSQDLAGVADVLMRQVGVWIFGVQRAKHEIERALDHMPEGLPSRRPRPQDIATLSKGQFYVCFGREMYKVYVQPAWMTAAHAEAIARGEEDVSSARDILQDFDQSRTAEVKPRISKAAREDAVWKEKYDALKLECDQLRGAHEAMASKLRALEEGASKGDAAAPRSPQSASLTGVPSLNDIYGYVKERASKDPGILQLLASQPKILVKVERPTVEADGKTLRGVLALLIAEKFFDAKKNGNQAFQEVQRRGRRTAKPNVYRELDGLAELGFLSKEDGGYQSVPGMKVNIVEEKAGAARA